jgi:hypothetical protein
LRIGNPGNQKTDNIRRLAELFSSNCLPIAEICLSSRTTLAGV